MVISVIICAVVLELGLRTYSTFFFPKMMVLDDRLGWKHAANVKKTFVNDFGERSLVIQNAHGQRGKYYRFAREPGKYRVLVLGDSFTEGVQVSEEDLFTSRLEEINPRLEVINAGVGGYGTVQEFLYLSTEGLQFKPDLVLLMLFENDLSDNCLPTIPDSALVPMQSQKNGEIQIAGKLDPAEFLKFTLPIPFRDELNRYSYLYYFLNSRIYQRLFSNRMKQFLQADLRKLRSSEEYEVFYAIIQKMHNLAVSKGVNFALVLIPTREDVGLRSSPTRQSIAKFCQDNRIKCIQLLERFKKESASGSEPYLHFDMHWNKAGHKIVAEEIASYLASTVNPS